MDEGGQVGECPFLFEIRWATRCRCPKKGPNSPLAPSRQLSELCPWLYKPKCCFPPRPSSPCRVLLACPGGQPGRVPFLIETNPQITALFLVILPRRGWRPARFMGPGAVSPSVFQQLSAATCNSLVWAPNWFLRLRLRTVAFFYLPWVLSGSFRGQRWWSRVADHKRRAECL